MNKQIQKYFDASESCANLLVSRSRPPPVRIENFIEHVYNHHKDSDFSFSAEYAVSLNASMCFFVLL